MNEKTCFKLLGRIIDQLERWADESENGGWSTHQVEPMRRLAREIRSSLRKSAPRTPVPPEMTDSRRRS